MKSPSRPRGSSCRTSPACPASSIWRPCAKPSCGSAAIRSGSIRWRPPSWSSITRCRWTNTAPPIRWSTTTRSNSSATANATCFLRWGQTAFSNFKVVPPNTGIVHQVNIERLARVIFSDEAAGKKLAYPDTLVGTDSHTTMVNWLGSARLGRGRHRGRSGHAGAARHHADSAGHRFQAHGQLAGGHHGHRPRAHGHRDSAQERRGGQIRGILRRRPQGLALGGPRHHRQHVAGVRLHLRDLPHR